MNDATHQPIAPCPNGIGRTTLRAAAVQRVGVPLWIVSSRRRWRACERDGFYRPPARADAKRIVVALHGDVGRLALAAFGACRVDLIALAINPRALPGSGPENCVRVDLDADGRSVLRLERPDVARAAIVAFERLAPLPDEAGYREPLLETDSDRERKRDRDGRRRTP